MAFRCSTSILSAAILAAGLSFAPPPAAAQAAPGYTVTGTLRVDGGSTVRSWSCEATTMSARMTGTPGSSLALGQLANAVSALQFEVPAAQLDCDNDTMNDHMWSALKTSDHPRIVFRMTSYSVAPATAGPARVQVQGQLEMAGETRPITLVGEASGADGGAMRLQGSHALNMTEWGIRPPRLMLGTLRVHEDVEVHFDLRVVPR
ncbi:YceI family protein [soil metagenome]